MVLAVAYTGGPFPYGYRALGEVFVFVFFGLVAVVGTTYVQTETWEWASLAPSLGAAVGIGAVLVPFPAAVDDHQTHNAQYLVSEGAAVLIPDRDLTAERLADELQGLCAGRGKLLAMAERARLLAKPHAAEELAESCIELARRAA